MMWKWQNGRQNPFYDKLLLFRLFNFMDCWLIKYENGVGIPYHTDKVEGKKHYRLNIILKNGGEFWLERKHIKKRVIFFRPDIQPHCVKVFGDEKRLVLSIGWAMR